MVGKIFLMYVQTIPLELKMQVANDTNTFAIESLWGGNQLIHGYISRFRIVIR